MGYALNGNKGSALDKKFSHFLYHNIGFALNTNGITKGVHIEKIMLLYEGSGKDKISDLTVNLIKHFFLEYTENFALKYISQNLCETFPIDKAYFNYETESFVTKDYTLPYTIDSSGRKDYVILTPYNILREDEPSISKKHFYQHITQINSSIDNDELRTQVNNYISKAIYKYEQDQRRKHKKVNEKTVSKIEKQSFIEMVNAHPELYDYFIKFCEDNSNQVKNICSNEVTIQQKKFIVNSCNIISLFWHKGYTTDKSLNAHEEAKSRLVYFKHIIEDCDGYKNFYSDSKCIASENDLQRMFKFVWYGTSFKPDFETNNGRGPADLIVSKGQLNQCVVEFKLASNSNLPHVFKQVKIYERANSVEGSLIAIFYFSQLEFERTYKIVKEAGYENLIGTSIFLIDCRNDNKISASKPSAE